MFCESEFKFLLKTLDKLRVRHLTLTLSDKTAKAFANDLTHLLGYSEGFDLPLKKYLNNPQTKTIYKLTDSFKLNYVYFLYGQAEKPVLVVIGPFLNETQSAGQLLELGEKLSVSPTNQREMEQFFSQLPVLLVSNPVFLMIDTFLETVWQTQDFAVVDVNREYRFPVSPITETVKGENGEDIMLSMKNMEKRYDYENQLIQAVSRGHIHEEARLLSSFSAENFEPRSADPLRNMKNYAIIMNTLLRKAAEKGGVHPVYLDSVSSAFAKRIEQLISVSRCYPLMREMFLSYCRLVRKHSIKNYTPLVQKAVLIIESDLSADLSPKNIAENLKISLGYLCSVFKKETGKTVCEYVREKRVNHAIHLLNTTQLQIQTVSWHCGIMDVQYFSKIFKKQTGKTPKEYRETLRRLNHSSF